MTSQTEQISNRERGAYFVSIGTSLALESAAGVYPDRPDPKPVIHDVKQIWFNLRTLIRNILGALPTELKDSVLPKNVVEALVSEMKVLDELVHSLSNGQATAQFYVCDFSRLARKYPYANIKTPTTPKQIQQAHIEEEILRLTGKESLPVDVHVFEHEFTGRHPNALILTHHPIDLLSRYQFARLRLLESHTGAIKDYPQWHTKLTNGKELEHIPFNEFSLQVFGDNGNLFSPFLSKTKKRVLTLASEDRWTSVTTKEKIRFSLKTIDNPAERDLLLSLL